MTREEPFAVAFIDMKMPGIDGATTAKKIWELDPEIKIVIVTAFGECSPDDIVTIVGRDDLFYLNKPFNQGEIKQFTRALLEQWNLAAEREKLQFELERKNLYLNELTENLGKALAEVKKLSGFLPICSFCKRIRNDKGYWQQLEEYISEHSEAEFSHGMCSECMEKHYGEFLRDTEEEFGKGNDGK